MGLYMATGKKMSEYTPFSELSSEEKAIYVGNASVTTFGAKVSEGDNINVNIPLSTLVPSATDLAGDGLSVNGSTGKLDVSNKVPAPTATTDRGKVLTVNSSDEVVWATPAAPSVSIDGDSIINGANGLEVNTGRGLQIGSGAVMTRLTENGGLDYDDNEGARGIKVVAGTGVTLDSTGGVGLDFTGADNGDVLSCVKTVEDGTTTYDINWVAPGGGGGGNPYTKASVTPGDCYLNGKISDYNMPLYDQDVTISNNTYSVLPSPIGYYPAVYEPEYRNAHNLDNLVIKLPSNTEFPMAVVEFTVQDAEYYSDWGCVNNVKVKIGETELTRMYSAPYNPNTLLMTGEYNNEFEYWTLTQVPNSGNPYYRVEGVFNANRGADFSAFGHGTKVQVQIFGSCFNVTMSQVCGEPAAS